MDKIPIWVWGVLVVVLVVGQVMHWIALVEVRAAVLPAAGTPEAGE